MNNIVEIKNLSHRYSKDWAVKDISFKIDTKGILGLLGSNGAGKSTMMNILCGVINQTKGTVLIDGIDLRESPILAKSQIGFLPQKAPLYPELTVDEYLVHCAYLRSIEPEKVREAVEVAKKKCGISHFSNRVIRNLSGGYQQRVGIAQAIIHNPKLVVLDEPTNGLDPNQIHEVRQLIKEIAEDRSVMISTHILSEVQATCKDIIMIEKGDVVFTGTLQKFNNYIKPEWIYVELDTPPKKDELLKIEGVINVEFLDANKLKIKYQKEIDIARILVDESAKKCWGLREVYIKKTSMESIFAELSNKK